MQYYGQRQRDAVKDSCLGKQHDNFLCAQLSITATYTHCEITNGWLAASRTAALMSRTSRTDTRAKARLLNVATVKVNSQKHTAHQDLALPHSTNF